MQPILYTPVYDAIDDCCIIVNTTQDNLWSQCTGGSLCFKIWYTQNAQHKYHCIIHGQFERDAFAELKFGSIDKALQSKEQIDCDWRYSAVGIRCKGNENLQILHY